MTRAYRSIAKIAKTHGRKGEVVAVPTHDLPLLLREGLEVFVVPPELRGPRSHVIDSCVNMPGGQRISLDGVSGIGSASKIVGKELLARTCDLPQDFMLRDEASIVGHRVYDEVSGDLGIVTAVVRGPMQDLWQVEGPRGEVLIPAVEELVTSIDEDAIWVSLPAGLVELGGR